MSPERIRFGPAHNPAKYLFVEKDGLYLGETDIGLGPTALSVLGVLLSRAGSKISPDVLIDAVRGHGWDGDPSRFAAEYIRQIRDVLHKNERFDAIRSERDLGYVFRWKVSIEYPTRVPDLQRPLEKRETDQIANILEKSYFKYRGEVVPAAYSKETIRSLAKRYECEPFSIADELFPVTRLWHNEDKLIHPDQILGTLDKSPQEKLAKSATLSPVEYAQARQLVEKELTQGPIKHEGLEYCMTQVKLGGLLPRIDARFGHYYDTVLTQYAIAWELSSALKKYGSRALDMDAQRILPLREAAGRDGNPLHFGTQRTAAISVSMLLVFERPRKGLWTVICRRSKNVAVSPGMLHVVPSGMFEAINPADQWSVQDALWRELLEELYGEKEQQGDGLPCFEDDLVNKKPIRTLTRLILEGQAELSITGVCGDLLNLQTEICTILFVRDASFAKNRRMKANWEYDLTGNPGSFGTPWNQIDIWMRNLKAGTITPTGLASLEMGRGWLQRRHGI
jgi:hypothetical protein